MNSSPLRTQRPAMVTIEMNRPVTRTRTGHTDGAIAQPAAGRWPASTGDRLACRRPDCPTSEDSCAGRPLLNGPYRAVTRPTWDRQAR